MEENEKLKLDEKYMRAAIKQAQKAYAINETPIGCVIVYEGKIIGRGYNRRNTDKDPLAHAEIKAIKKASKKNGRLEAGAMYNVCDVRAMSNVRRSNHSVEADPRCCRMHESKSRMCGIGFESFGYKTI